MTKTFKNTNYVPKSWVDIYALWTNEFLVAKLLYKSKCTSICQPRGNVIFSALNWDIAPFFFVQIPFINEHLFCKYFVRLSVGNATKVFATYGCFHPCFFLFSLDSCLWFSIEAHFFQSLSFRSFQDDYMLFSLPVIKIEIFGQC